MANITRDNFQHFNSRTFVAPVHTPYSDDECNNVDYELIPQLATNMRSKGFNAVFVAGTNGESYMLTKEERKRALEAWMQCEEVKSGELRVIAHISCQSLQESIELAKFAESVGCDCIGYMVSCFFKPNSVEDTAKLLATVANAVPNIGVIYYHFPVMTGINAKVAPVLKLANELAPNVVGCKFTHTDLGDFAAGVDMGFDMIIGNGDELILPCLTLGGFGGFSLISMIGAQHLIQKVWDSFEAGDLKAAQKAQAAAREAMSIVANNSTGFISTGKYLTSEISGLKLGYCREPIPRTAPNEDLVNAFIAWISYE